MKIRRREAAESAAYLAARYESCPDDAHGASANNRPIARTVSRLQGRKPRWSAQKRTPSRYSGRSIPASKKMPGAFGKESHHPPSTNRALIQLIANLPFQRRRNHNSTIDVVMAHQRPIETGSRVLHERKQCVLRC